MISILIFSLCCLTAGANFLPQGFSFSQSVGEGEGDSFASSGEGHITGVRVWEVNGGYIRGFQLRYGSVWTPVFGNSDHQQQEMLLFGDEAIVQISGKYHPSNYIYQLIFVTNKGRFLTAGQPVGTSFNLYPTDGQGELRLVSGRFNGNGITAIAAHWAAVYAVANT